MKRIGAVWPLAARLAGDRAREPIGGGAPDPAGQLDGVSCTSAANCWAVGSRETKSATLNQILHWTGKKWFRAATPNPGGTGPEHGSELIEVRCTSAANCWAVGDYGKDHAELDEMLHWNGTKWSLAATPTPGGTLAGDFNDLVDIACVFGPP